MASTMTTRNAGRRTAATRGGGTSEQDGREGERTDDQVRNDRNDQGSGREPEVVKEVVRVTKQLQNLLPTIEAQVGNHVGNQGNNENQGDNVVNDNIQSNSGQATVLRHAFTAGTLHNPSTGAWNMDTGASSHLKNYVTSLSTVLNSCMYSTDSVGDGHSIPVSNTGHSILPTPLKSLRLNNVLITPHIVKNLIPVCQFVRDNDYTIEFDSFGFSVKDFMTRRVLLRCDSTGDLYHVTAPSPIPHAFLVSQHMWHHHLGHPGSDVLRRLVSNNVISCNKKKPPVLCHVCQLGKHVRLSFVSSNTIVSSCFDIVHSDMWTSPIPSLSGFQFCS
ncbi:ribonuclease H-like domain-containing protein [Tanacetum coccineum]|uniref:Ribonuclease H-like domain-containing protein n=1 Tax=Tanacetum coccineum TaxID=301880 RepID=A0ABQ5AZF8_9ASTR